MNKTLARAGHLKLEKESVDSSLTPDASALRSINPRLVRQRGIPYPPIRENLGVD